MDVQELVLYLKILKKRWWLLLLLVVSTVCSILVISFTSKPVYQASLKFLFSTPPVAELTVSGSFRAPTVRDEVPYERANFIDILDSRSTIWQAIEALGVNISADDVVVTIASSETSDLTTLTVEAEHAQLAADIANALMDAAIEAYSALRAKPTTVSREFISSQLQAAHVRWKQAQEKVIQFQIENGIGDFNSALDSHQSLLRSLNLERDRALAAGNRQEAAQYEEIIAKREEELQKLLWLNSEYAELETEVQQSWELYQLLLSKETEATLNENEILNAGFVSILRPAQKPTHSVSPFNFKVLVLGIVVSLILGGVISFAWEYIETRHGYTDTDELVLAKEHKVSGNVP